MNNQLDVFCTNIVPDFTPLGGSRPDAAIVALVAVRQGEEKEVEEDVILPPDVLDTALAMLCAPLIVKHVGDFRDREAYFLSPTATVRLYTTDEDVLRALKRITASIPGGGLSVTVLLDESVTELPDEFLARCAAVRMADLRQTNVTEDWWQSFSGFLSLSDCSHPPAVSH